MATKARRWALVVLAALVLAGGAVAVEADGAAAYCYCHGDDY